MFPEGYGMQTIGAQDIVDTVTSGLLVLDMDLTVRSANRAFYRTFRVEPDATVGRPLFELGDGQWDIPELRRLLLEIVPRDETVEGYEVGHEFPGIGLKCMRLNARKVFR
jgi:PAS domain-containing protein